jgi:adenosine deaminase CECR1
MDCSDLSPRTTRLWQIVRKMPKGTLLHAHIGATVDLEWVFNQAIDTPGLTISAPVPLDSDDARQGVMVRYKFSSTIDNSTPSIWTPEYLSHTRVSLKIAAETHPGGGRPAFVAWMKDRCSITQTESLQHHLGVDEVWRKLTAAFIILGPILYYEPILRAFVRQLFLTLIEDGVRWVEVRAVLRSPFTLAGKDVPETGPLELARVLNEIIEVFMASEESKGFWGARVIWTSMRGEDTSVIIHGMSSHYRLRIIGTNSLCYRHEAVH